MIRAVLYDAGGVLHTAQPDAALMHSFAVDVLQILKENGAVLSATPEELIQTLAMRGKEYKHYAEETKVELPATQILEEFYLKDFSIPSKILEPCAERICHLYDAQRNRITMRPSLPATVQALHSMGIRQGVISNIISTTFVPMALRQYGIAQYMECVILSSQTGIRKPDAEIFYIALKQMQLPPKEVCYVGDTISRDVIGARAAGLGLMIQMRYPPTEHKDELYQNSGYKPDYKIEDLREIIPIIRNYNALAAHNKKGGGG